MIAQSDERLVLIPRFASLMDTGRDPAGILCALSSPAVLLLYYLSVTKRQAPTSLDDPRFLGISAQESCYWTSRPYLLGGVAISFIFTCIAGISEAMALKVIPVLGGFMATMLAGAFSVLVVAFIYVERHWKEWWQQVRGTDSWDAETAFWRPYRKRFLRIVILISGAFFFLARFGYLERIERSPIVGLYQPIGLAVAAMILILLWGSRNSFLVLLRGAALLLMTGILTAGTVGLFYALFENQVTPAVALPLAAMVCVNFIFHHRWERSNLGWLELTPTNPESRPPIPFYTAIERSTPGGDHKDFSNLEDSPEVVRLREKFESELLSPRRRPAEDKPLLTTLLSGSSGVFTVTLPDSNPCLLTFSTPLRAAAYAHVHAGSLALKYLSSSPREFVQMLTDLKRNSAVQKFAVDVCPYCLTFPVLAMDSLLTPAWVVKIWAIHKSGELAREVLYSAQAKNAFAHGNLQLAKATALEAVQHVTGESPRLHLLLGKIALSLGEKDLYREATAFLEFLKADQFLRELLAAEICGEIQN